MNKEYLERISKIAMESRVESFPYLYLCQENSEGLAGDWMDMSSRSVIGPKFKAILLKEKPLYFYKEARADGSEKSVYFDFDEVQKDTLKFSRTTEKGVNAFYYGSERLRYCVYLYLYVLTKEPFTAVTRITSGGLEQYFAFTKEASNYNHTYEGKTYAIPKDALIVEISSTKKKNVAVYLAPKYKIIGVADESMYDTVQETLATLTVDANKNISSNQTHSQKLLPEPLDEIEDEDEDDEVVEVAKSKSKAKAKARVVEDEDEDEDDEEVVEVAKSKSKAKAKARVVEDEDEDDEEVLDDLFD